MEKKVKKEFAGPSLTDDIYGIMRLGEADISRDRAGALKKMKRMNRENVWNVYPDDNFIPQALR